MLRHLLSALAALMLLAGGVQASDRLDHLAGLAGDHFVLDAEEIGRPFHVFVRLPEAYDREAGPWPTVYLLDGDILFPLLGAYHLLLHYDEPVPDAIVVGITYGTFDRDGGNFRDTDYSVAPMEGKNFGGGAPAFQRFIADELIPAVEERYRSDPSRRILVGQSRGAHFVLYSALTAPDLFWGRIASNPSLNPNPPYFFEAPMPPRADTSVYFASGERDIPRLRTEALQLFGAWEGRADLPWRYRAETIDDGTHAARIAEVYRRGMIWLFENEPRPDAAP